MSDVLAKAWELVDAGDVQGAVWQLRAHAADVTATTIAPLVERVARLADMPDLAAASAALAADPGSPQALYDYGYQCVDSGASFLAVPALGEALRLAPDARGVLVELVTALEHEERHGEAVAVLREREAGLPAWPEGYLLAYNALMSGDVEAARAAWTALPEPVGEDQRWEPAFARLRRMLDRAAVAQEFCPLDGHDLRGWHFVLTGGVLTTLSPWGFDAGMNGRWGYIQETLGSCLWGLRRLRLVLDTAGCAPCSVSLLPDRSSHIMGLAAAQVLGLPAEPYAAGRSDTVVVAYDLGEVDDTIVSGLRERVPGQVLFEHATCWTTPPAASADVSTLLAQFSTPPWGRGLRRGADGSVERMPADDRPAEEVAAGILQADDTPDSGDEQTPADPDEVLASFVARLAGHRPNGPRWSPNSPGPVHSGRLG